MRGFFEIRTPLDLLNKLDREFRRFSDNPRDSDTAFNFFVTAWHLLEWSLPGDANKPAREALRNNSHLLRICHHIATGAKHYEPRKYHQSVEDMYRDRDLSRQLLDAGQVHLAILTDRLMVRLDPTVREYYGGRAEIPAQGLAAEVLDYWREYFTGSAEK